MRKIDCNFYMNKHFGAVLLTLFICFLSSELFATEDRTYLQTGDYIYYGKYLNAPILWRVINDPESEDGALLFSERIISMKSFDSAGSVAGARDDRRRTRESFGSGFWPESVLRNWLNSSVEKVSYPYYPPTEDRVMGRQNFEDEPGFLSNFSDSERTLLIPYTHRVLLSPIDSSLKEGGSEPYLYACDISQSMQNFDKAYYKYSTDKVFVPGIDIIYNLIHSRGWSHFKKPTQELVEKEGSFVNRRKMPFNEDMYWWYWLTTPHTDTLQFMVVAATDRIGSMRGGTLSLFHTHDGVGGVAPLVFIPSTLPAADGNGSIEDPYFILHSGK